MSNNGPKKPTPFPTSYEEKQGLYYSLPAATRTKLGSKFTKEMSEREHVSGLQTLNNSHPSTLLAVITEVDESTSTNVNAAATNSSMTVVDEETTSTNSNSETPSASDRSTRSIRHRQ